MIMKWIWNDSVDSIVKKLMLLFMVLTIAAASFEGFFSKWSFRDDAGHKFGIVYMIEGTADRPFAYRRLLPETAKFIVKAMPDKAQEKLNQKLAERQPAETVYARAQAPEQYRIEYYLMMVFCYLFLVGSVYLFRALFIEVTGDAVTGTLTAFVLTLVFPYVECLGGYYYDIPELFFFALTARLALKGNFFLLCLVSAVATVNKESFFFFLFTLFPLLYDRYGKKKSILMTGTMVFISGCIYLLVASLYQGNLGGAVEFHLWDHIRKLFNLNSYFLTSTTYGLPLGSGFFITHMLYVAWIIWQSWHMIPQVWKYQAILALVINLPLYLLFAASGEIRNLSLLYVSFFVMLAFWLHDMVRRYYNSNFAHGKWPMCLIESACWPQKISTSCTLT